MVRGEDGMLVRFVLVDLVLVDALVPVLWPTGTGADVMSGSRRQGSAVW